MSARSLRINIQCEEPVAGLLAHLAHQKHTSITNFAKELIIEALERHEDIALSAIAEARDKPNAKRVKHKDVWKKAL